jgi:hypothetical protein
MASSACLEDPDESCGAGQKFENKVCVPDDGSDDETDAGSMPVGDDAATGGVDPKGFGDACMDDTGCMPNAPYCAKQPGSTTGYCTKQGCEVDNAAAVCPANWTCFDLATFGASGTLCWKPS